MYDSIHFAYIYGKLQPRYLNRKYATFLFQDLPNVVIQKIIIILIPCYYIFRFLLF